MVRQWSLPNYFASKTKNFAALLFFLGHAIKNSSGQMRQISRRMEMIHTMIGWRRDEYGTHKHAHGSWILWSVSRVRSKTMHSLFCIMSWLPYINLCYIDSRFFLPLEQSRTALLGCRLAASRLREAARWQLKHTDVQKIQKYGFLRYINCAQRWSKVFTICLFLHWFIAFYPSK